MNKDIIISTINASNTFQKNHTSYVSYVAQLKEAGEKISPATFLEIHDAAKKRLEELDKLKKEMSKLEGLIPPESYKKLISSIENEAALASMLQSDSESFLNTQDKKFEESIIAGAEYEQEYSMELSGALATIERQMGIAISGLVFNEKMSLEEMKEIAKSLEEGSPFQKQMADLANYMERKQEKEKEQNQAQQENVNNNTQQVTNHTEMIPLNPIPNTLQGVNVSDNFVPKPLVGEAANIKPKEPTLADKIAGITYSKDRNMVAEVQALTVEERMAQIAGILTALSTKEKLSLSDMIQIHTLQEEQVQLEAYVSSLENQKLSRSETKRNKKMAVATDKIEQNKRLIAQSMRNSEHYNSKIMRFFSARYQEQLASKVEDLRDKRGVLQEQQKMSAIAKYNKNSGKISRNSKVVGLAKGTRQFANQKIEELKALRDQVVNEVQNFSQDLARFTSERHMIPQLRESTLIALDPITGLSQYRELQAQANQL